MKRVGMEIGKCGNPESFGKLLKVIRVRFHMTQEVFALLVGFPVSNIKAWELGRQLPTFNNFDILIKGIKGKLQTGNYNVNTGDLVKLRELYERGKAKGAERRGQNIRSREQHNN